MVHCWHMQWLLFSGSVCAALLSQVLPLPAMLHTPSVTVHVCVDGA